MNMNVDEFGIPLPGFIKADKQRRAQERKMTDSTNVNLLSPSNNTEHKTFLATLFTSRASLAGLAVILLMTGTIAYLIGQNRALSKEVAAVATSAPQNADVAVLQKQIELEKLRVVRRQNGEPDTLKGEMQNSLAELRQVLSEDSVLQGSHPLSTVVFAEQAPLKQVIDDKSLSLSDPLHGQVVKLPDPEIEKMRDRAISLIQAQSLTEN